MFSSRQDFLIAGYKLTYDLNVLFNVGGYIHTNKQRTSMFSLRQEFLIIQVDKGPECSLRERSSAYDQTKNFSVPFNVGVLHYVIRSKRTCKFLLKQGFPHYTYCQRRFKIGIPHYTCQRTSVYLCKQKFPYYTVQEAKGFQYAHGYNQTKLHSPCM